MLAAISNTFGRWLVPAALYLTVLAFAAGSSSVAAVTRAATSLRWASLFGLCGAALLLAAALVRERRSLPGLWFAPFLVALVLLSAASASWSVDPSLTLQRTASFAILLLAAGALGCAAALDRRVASRLLVAVVAAATTVALLGVLMLALDPMLAIQGFNAPGTFRYRGFGQNPNTAPMLYAVALPPTGWLALCARSGRVRVAAGAAAVLFGGSVIASLSRGAMLACLFGACVVALTLISGWRRRTAAVLTIFVVFVGGNALRDALPGPAYSEGVLNYAGKPGDALPGSTAGPVSGSGPGEGPKEPGKTRRLPELRVYPEDEIGHPVFGLVTASSGSGRVAAWKETIEDVRERPIVGTGFGTESLAFTDRWYFFQGGNPENAYLGLLLQLGGVGLALFLALGLALLFAGVAAVRRARGEERGLLAATLGTVIAGAVLMVSQSYVYAVGNIATVTFWVCAFVLAALTGRPNRPGHATTALVCVIVAAVGAAVVVGGWEESRALEREQARLDADYALVGREIDGPSLSAFRRTALSCLYYDLGGKRYSLTLCFDDAGRLVETANRLGPEPEYSSLVLHPESAPVTVDRARLRALLLRIGALSS